jgi:hypothetical protein
MWERTFWKGRSGKSCSFVWKGQRLSHRLAQGLARLEDKLAEMQLASPNTFKAIHTVLAFRVCSLLPSSKHANQAPGVFESKARICCLGGARRLRASNRVVPRPRFLHSRLCRRGRPSDAGPSGATPRRQPLTPGGRWRLLISRARAFVSVGPHSTHISAWRPRVGQAELERYLNIEVLWSVLGMVSFNFFNGDHPVRHLNTIIHGAAPGRQRPAPTAPIDFSSLVNRTGVPTQVVACFVKDKREGGEGGPPPATATAAADAEGGRGKSLMGAWPSPCPVFRPLLLPRLPAAATVAAAVAAAAAAAAVFTAPPLPAARALLHTILTAVLPRLGRRRQQWREGGHRREPDRRRCR